MKNSEGDRAIGTIQVHVRNTEFLLFFIMCAFEVTECKARRRFRPASNEHPFAQFGIALAMSIFQPVKENTIF